MTAPVGSGRLPGRGAAATVASVLAGVVLYLAMVGRVDGWSILQGLVLAAAAQALSRRLLPEERERRHARSWRALARMVAEVPRQIFEGAWSVGMAAIGLRPLPRAEIVELEVGDRPRVAPETLALLETVSPGTYLIDADRDRRRLRFHVFDHREADELRERTLHALAARDEEAGGREPGHEQEDRR